MAVQRFYLANSLSAYAPASTQGSFELIGGSVPVHKLTKARTGAQTTLAVPESTTAQPLDVLVVKFVTDQAGAAATISGTVDVVYTLTMDSTSSGMYAFFHLYVEAPDGSVRGTLAANYTNSTIAVTTGKAVGVSGLAITSLAIQPGDRIVLEVGYESRNTVATTKTGTVQFGGTGTTDNALGNTSSAANRPDWMQFSAGADVAFATAYVPPAPVADFAADVTSGTAPVTVNFTDASTNFPTGWAWDFGDGTTSTSQNPSKTYSAAGTYTVSLVATNAGGSSTMTKTAYVTIDAPPTPTTNPQDFFAFF